jgi:hypothetical protein
MRSAAPTFIAAPCPVRLRIGFMRSTSDASPLTVRNAAIAAAGQERR